MKKQLGWLTLLLFTSSCSGWNSELDTAFIEDSNKDKKPICEFDAADTCFAKSVDLLLDCVQPVGEFPEEMHEEMDFCTNNNGKTVVFKEGSLLKHFQNPERVLNFQVRSGKKTCFHFRGTQNSFSIKSNTYGTLSVRELSNGDRQVSCFFDDGFVIPKAALAEGCRNQKTKALNFVPGNKLTVKKTKMNTGEVVFDHFQFSFLGTGAPEEPLFKCEL